MGFNVIAVGDTVGKTGLAMLKKHLRSLIKRENALFTVVNGENAAGLGITPEQAEEIFGCGADAITLGNHTFGQNAIKNYLDDCRWILRPANFAPQCPGRGAGVFEAPFGEVAVINLIGRVSMPGHFENPFFEVERQLKQIKTPFVLIDFHAEATSEKLALSYALDGRISALWGTHTHVQTSDARVMPGGAGYITDLGMTGAVESVIGVRPEQSVGMFRGDPPCRFETAAGAGKLEYAVFEIDEKTGKCLSARAGRIL